MSTTTTERHATHQAHTERPWEAEPRRYSQGARLCALPGCDRPHYSRNLCRRHYGRTMAHGTPHAIVRKRPTGTPRLCEVEGCDRPHTAKGLCQMHRHRTERNGNPHTTRRDYNHRHPNGVLVGYGAAHVRVRAGRGRAVEHPCAECGTETGPREWALVGQAGPVLQSTERRQRHHGSRYSLATEDYVPLCVPCHRELDAITTPSLEAVYAGLVHI